MIAQREPPAPESAVQHKPRASLEPARQSARNGPRARSWQRIGALIALLGALLQPLSAAAAPPTGVRATPCPRAGLVAAASSLRFAMPALASAFRARTGCRLAISFGSSGTIARQIRQGAPYALFLSADDSYIKALEKDGLAKAPASLYALGRLALFAPNDSPLAVDPKLEGLAKALARGAISLFAIANPDHAPYGRAARDALERAGLWAAVKPRLVLGASVAQAARFTLTSRVQGGLIAYALLKAPAYARAGRHAVLPARAHRPIRHAMVLLDPRDEAARRFHAFLTTAPARDILRRFGFALPGEEEEAPAAGAPRR